MVIISNNIIIFGTNSDLLASNIRYNTLLSLFNNNLVILELLISLN